MSAIDNLAILVGHDGTGSSKGIVPQRRPATLRPRPYARACDPKVNIKKRKRIAVRHVHGLAIRRPGTVRRYAPAIRRLHRHLLGALGSNMMKRFPIYVNENELDAIFECVNTLAADAVSNGEYSDKKQERQERRWLKVAQGATQRIIKHVTTTRQKRG